MLCAKHLSSETCDCIVEYIIYRMDNYGFVNDEVKTETMDVGNVAVYTTTLANFSTLPAHATSSLTYLDT